MVALYLAFLGFLVAERLVELWISRRHLAWALAEGGVELGRNNFTWIKILHGVFILSCAGEVLVLHRPFIPELGIPMLGLALAAQAVRYWAVFSLGRYWNTGVVVVPGASPITTGPYRHLRHPNYLAVIVEGFAVPLIHSAWITAFGFSLANGFLLRTRIRCEEEALDTLCGYRERFGDLPRLLPVPRRRDHE